jgi:hypothetical protein
MAAVSTVVPLAAALDCGLALCAPDGGAGPTAVRAPTAVRFGPVSARGMYGLRRCGRSWSVRSPCADRPAYPLHRV